jgi:hypothetical protein
LLSWKAIAQAGLTSDKLVGIGIGASGLVNPSEDTLIMSTTLDFMQNVHLKRIFEAEFQVPVLFENISPEDCRRRFQLDFRKDGPAGRQGKRENLLGDCGAGWKVSGTGVGKPREPLQSLNDCFGSESGPSLQ